MSTGKDGKTIRTRLFKKDSNTHKGIFKDKGILNH